jgi:hypothetical protein
MTLVSPPDRLRHFHRLMASEPMVRNGSGTALQLGREKVRFSILTCPPLPSPAVVNAQWTVHCLLLSLIIAAEAAWVPARLHSLKVSEPSLSQSHASTYG